MARMNVLAEVAKGLKANIHAVDNLSPVSRVAVCIKAGSRYEPNHVPGISHHMRAAAGLTTQESSVFGIARHFERAGATLKVTSDREHIIYKVACLRDKLDYVLGFIDDTIHKPEYRAWELVDITQTRLKYEIEQYKKNQYAIANEAMHKVAFRGGLAHPIFSPEHRIEKLNRNDLFDYLDNNFVLDRMTFTGLGCDPEELREIIDGKFSLNGKEYKGVKGESRYIGGGESRIQAGFPKTQVNFVVKSMPLQDVKSLAALEIISSALSPQISIPTGRGAINSLMHTLSSNSPGIRASMINLSYQDTGLFGISMVGPNEESFRSAVLAGVTHFKKVLGVLNINDVKAAKRCAKARSMIQSENQDLVFDTMAKRHACGVLGQSPLDLVEDLTLDDVHRVASLLLRSKPTMVVVGNPRFVPYIDELNYN